MIVGVGGFLGIGEKDVAVNFASIEPRSDEDGDVSLYLNATQEQLEAAPEFHTLADLEAERMADQPPAGRSGRCRRHPSPRRLSSRPLTNEAASPPGQPGGLDFVQLNQTAKMPKFPPKASTILFQSSEVETGPSSR